MMLRIQPKLFVLLALGFVAATIVGTLLHEAGHWAVSEALGYDARIAYAYTGAIDTRPRSASHRFAILLGGPLQTVLTGTAAWLYLRFTRRRFREAQSLPLLRWTTIFLALFWLRQPANAVMWSAGRLMVGQWSSGGDEIRLARSMGLPSGTPLILSAVVGAAVAAYIAFRVVPRPQRPTFMAAGLAGGVFGYLFWLEWVGPLVLP